MIIEQIATPLTVARNDSRYFYSFIIQSGHRAGFIVNTAHSSQSVKLAVDCVLSLCNNPKIVLQIICALQEKAL